MRMQKIINLRSLSYSLMVFREKKKAEFENYLRRMMNRFSKELLEETHKVCLFSTLVCLE